MTNTDQNRTENPHVEIIPEKSHKDKENDGHNKENKDGPILKNENKPIAAQTKKKIEKSYVLAEEFKYKEWIVAYQKVEKEKGVSREEIAKSTETPLAIVNAIHLGVIPDHRSIHDLSRWGGLSLAAFEMTEQEKLAQQEAWKKKLQEKRAQKPKPKRKPAVKSANQKDKEAHFEGEEIAVSPKGGPEEERLKKKIEHKKRSVSAGEDLAVVDGEEKRRDIQPARVKRNKL